MLIGGYEPCSLCDYPGKAASVVFTQGCNFRCPFCHNAGLLPVSAPAERLISVDEVLRLTNERRYRLRSMVVTGGEPTLQADLPAFLNAVRSLGVAIKLDTNGSHPDVLREVLSKGLVDYVAMDLKAPWAKYAGLTGCAAPLEAIRESISRISTSGLPHEFRTTWVNDLLTDDDIEAIRGMVPVGSSYRVQPFRAAYALDSRLRQAPAD